MNVNEFLSLLTDLPSDRQIRLANGMRALGEALRDAAGLHVDARQFAVPLTELREAGLTGRDIRWLLACGIILAAALKGNAHSGRERPKEESYLLAPAAAPQVLAWSDAAIAVQFRSAKRTKDPVRPRWDGVQRQLWLGERLIKQYRVPAINQSLILFSFEELRWLPRIDDPLPPDTKIDCKDRLKEAIKRLNRWQKPRGIRFSGDGSGSRGLLERG